MPRRYTAYAPGESTPIMRSDVFADTIQADVPIDEPIDSRQPVREFYCPNSDCTARQITIAERIADRGRRPQPRCPLCGGHLLFNHFVGTISLIPDAPEDEPPSRLPRLIPDPADAERRRAEREAFLASLSPSDRAAVQRLIDLQARDGGE